MREQTAIENANILEHFELKNYELKEIVLELGLSGLFLEEDYVFPNGIPK